MCKVIGYVWREKTMVVFWRSREANENENEMRIVS
jgi:hypothetical protein